MGRVAVDPSDLNTQARIRNAALEAFARRGIAGTSIRDVARAADVSPGLVQHYFPSKAALRQGVNEYVTGVVAGAFEHLPELPTGAARADELGRRITGIFREHPLALLYGARAVVEQDETALGLFDTFVALAEDQWNQAAADG